MILIAQHAQRPSAPSRQRVGIGQHCGTLAYPRQRVADGRVNHTGAAEPGVHEDHARRLLAHLPDDLRLLATLYAPQRLCSRATRSVRSTASSASGKEKPITMSSGRKITGRLVSKPGPRSSAGRARLPTMTG